MNNWDLKKIAENIQDTIDAVIDAPNIYKNLPTYPLVKNNLFDDNDVDEQENIKRRRIMLKNITKDFPFSIKQKKLILSLISLKPISKIILEKRTGTDNLTALVRDTNKRLKGYKLDSIFKIQSLYRKKRIKNKYQIEISLNKKMLNSF